MPFNDTHSFETDLMICPETTSLEPSLSRRAFLYSHRRRNIIPFTGLNCLSKRLCIVTNHVVGVKGHCMVYFRVERRLAEQTSRTTIEVDWNRHVPGSQVKANTALYLLNTLELYILKHFDRNISQNERYSLYREFI